MHGFSFHVFEDKDGVQDVISPRSLDQISISNTPRMRKCIKKRFKPMDAWIGVSKQFDFTQKSKGILVHEEQFNLKRKRGVNVRSTVASRSTVTMERLLANRCLYLMIVWSQMKGWDAFSLREEGSASICCVRWIFIERFWLIWRSIGRDESRPL